MRTFSFIVLTFWVSLLAAQTTVCFQDGVSGYNGTAVTQLNEGTPNTNYGTDGTISIDTDDGGDELWGLVRFDLSSIPTNATVTAASFIIEVDNASLDAYELYPLNVPWTENGATWNTTDGTTPWNTAGAEGQGTDFTNTSMGSTPTALFGGTGQRTINLNGFGVTTVNNWVTNPGANFGFTIRRNSGTLFSDGLDFRTDDFGTVNQRPEFCVTYTVPLPVELLSLVAERAPQGVEVAWVGGPALSQGGQVVVERSEDGRTYQAVCTPLAATTGHTATTDPTAPLGRLHYRLRWTSPDGVTDYSQVVEVAPVVEVLDFNVLPNPASHTLRVQAANLPANSTLILRNLVGQTLAEWPVAGGASFNVADLPRGTYIATLSAEGKQVHKRVVLR